MDRFQERKSDFNKSLLKLKEGLNEPETEIVIDGILHRFEFTFELSWKMIKDYLEYLGISEKTGSPREIIKLAFKHGIIKQGDEWIDMMLSRNSLSHLYDENMSRNIYEKIKHKYIILLEQLSKDFENLQK